MDDLIHQLSNIPSSAWYAIAAAGVISIVLQAIKHYLEDINPKVLMALLTGFSFAVSGINYLLSQANQNPTVLGNETATLVGLATVLYRFVVKPGYALLLDVKQVRDQELAAKPAGATTTSTAAAPALANAVPASETEASF